MCIICIKKAQKPMVSDERIKYMFARNPDGAGLMWSENNEVHIKKGFMTVEPLLEFIHSRDWTEIPVVLHFRIGTSGLKDAWNCHPFPLRKKNMIEGTCNIAIAHNGILNEYTPSYGSSISDTQVFINKVLNKLPKRFYENEGIRLLLEHEIKGNRIVILSKSGSINKFGTWHEDEDGYVYSNPYYEPYTPKFTNPYCTSYGARSSNSYCFEPKTIITTSDDKAPDCDDLSFGSRLRKVSDSCWSMKLGVGEETAIRNELDSERISFCDNNWLSEDEMQEFEIDNDTLYMYLYNDI